MSQVLPPRSFWQAYVAMCSRLGVDPRALGSVIQMESGFRPDARNPADRSRPAIAQGLNQLTRSGIQGLGMDESTWLGFSDLPAEEQLPWVEKYMRRAGVKGATAGQIYRKNFGGFSNPDGSIYASNKAMQAYAALVASGEKVVLPGASSVFREPGLQDKAVLQNPGLVTDAGYGPVIFASALDALLQKHPLPAIAEAAIADAEKNPGEPEQKPIKGVSDNGGLLGMVVFGIAVLASKKGIF